MIALKRTDSDNPDFKHLIVFLDANLRENDGDEHAFYAQYNKTDAIKHVIVIYEDGKAAGCGAIKKYDETTAEIKRMYVLPEYRGHGIAKSILSELETWAKELGFSECILETGVKQVEAVHLYPKCGYEIIENYGQYAGAANSICMKKQL